MRGSKTKKATFNLSEQILQLLDEAVVNGAAPSKNAFVEQAIDDALRAAREQQRRRAWAQAANDPLFTRDVDTIEREFATADAETARDII
jgi:hypothetical protein